MKRLSLYLFLILFTLQTPSQADDIRDFQIEGMSIGDSLLDYFSEKEINNNKKYFYNNNKFISFSSDKSTFKTYDLVQFHYKDKDKKYKIHSLSGTLLFDNNIKNCLKKKDEIVKELSEIFNNQTKIKDFGTYSHSYDKSGKSKVTVVWFYFNNGDSTNVTCEDWSKKITEKKGYTDRLKVNLRTKELNIFIRNEAYK